MPKSHQNSIESMAPGRICLFGDHQDYLNLPVIACAINRFVCVRATAHEWPHFKINLKDIGETLTIPLSPSKFDHSNHLLALGYHVLCSEGLSIQQGYEVNVSGDLPINAGLSSSTALLVAWLQFLATVGSLSYNEKQLALWAYKAEVESRGGSGGKMDQFSITHGNHIFFDTKTDEVQFLQAKPPVLIVGVSGIPKNTDGMLKRLKALTWESIHYVSDHITNVDYTKLQPAELQPLLDAMPADLRAYYKAAVLNHSITLKAKTLLESPTPDWKQVGDLLNAHQSCLRDLLKVSIPRIDTMIEAALIAGALGAKIVGSGGGGCLMALAEPHTKEDVLTAIRKSGAQDAFVAEIVAGPQIKIENKA